jgi:hypothetical protein
MVYSAQSAAKLRIAWEGDIIANPDRISNQNVGFAVDSLYFAALIRTDETYS